MRAHDRGVTSKLDRESKLTAKVGRLLYPETVARPRVRSECEGGIRPCPFVSCRHNLYLDVQPSGHLKFNYPDGVEPWDVLPHMSCALDLADRQGLTLREVGDLLGITRERVRQIEIAAHPKFVRALPPELRSFVRLFADRGWDPV